MANTIQIKRGLEANLPLLSAGEFGFALDTGNLYCGNGTANVHINPPGGTADIAVALQTARPFSISGDATAPAVTFNGTASVDLVLTLAASGVTAGTYGKVTVNSKGLVTEGAQLTISDIGGLGTAAAANIGTASGNVVAVGGDGKIASTVIPAVAITDVFVVDTEAEMLALTAEQGDVAVRTDVSKSFILQQEPATAVENWIVLQTPTAPVLSVNGQTGAVVLTKSDVGLDLVENMANADRHVGSAAKLSPGATINGVTFTGEAPITVADATKMPLTGGTFTGNVTFDEDVVLDVSDGVLKVGAPGSADEAVNKGYVDTAVSSGTAAKAVQLNSAQDFSITGDVTAPVIAFNGTQAVALAATLADSGVTAGTYSKITVDSKGRATVGAQLTPADLGLGNVSNTPDDEKIVAEAAKLTTPRAFSISGGATAAAVQFDGSANVNLVVTAVDATMLTGVIDGGTF